MNTRASRWGWTAALSLPTIGGALLGMTVVTFLAQPIWGDQPIYLYIAGRLLDGARIDIQEFVDPNPPLIVWISGIPAALARLFRIPPQVAMELCLAALLAIAIVWCGRLIRRADRGGSPAFAWWLGCVILYAAAVYPWRYYAQREHLLVLMVLPYLAMVAMRLAGSAPAAWEAAVAGLLASVGFSLKPFNLVIVAAVEVLLLYRGRRARDLVRPEIVALVLGGIAYGAAVLLWAPDYLTRIAPMAEATWFDYGRVSLWEMADPTRLVKILGLIVAWAVLRRRLRHEPLASVVLVAALAAALAHLLQRKNLEYHFLPAMVLFNLALGIMAVDLFLSWTESWQSRWRLRTSLAAAGIAALAVAVLYYPPQSTRAATNWINDRVTTQLAITAALPPGSSLYILSPATGVIFDMVLERGLVWGSRFPCLWMLPSLFASEAPDAVKATIADWTRLAVSEDLERRRPSIVLVERCADRSIKPCTTMETLRVDLLAWFEHSPAFVLAWSRYSRRRGLGPYDLWCAEGSEEICRRAEASLETEDVVDASDPWR